MLDNKHYQKHITLDAAEAPIIWRISSICTWEDLGERVSGSI